MMVVPELLRSARASMAMAPLVHHLDQRLVSNAFDQMHHQATPIGIGDGNFPLLGHRPRGGISKTFEKTNRHPQLDQGVRALDEEQMETHGATPVPIVANVEENSTQV